MALVITVMLYKLTVSNCTESKTDVPVHCLMHNRTLSRVGTGGRRDYGAKWRRRRRTTHKAPDPERLTALTDAAQ